MSDIYTKIRHEMASQIPDWRECQRWLMENGHVVTKMKQGQMGEAAWEIWRRAFARGLWAGQNIKPPER
jgi:hypothetical protein